MSILGLASVIGKCSQADSRCQHAIIAKKWLINSSVTLYTSAVRFVSFRRFEYILQSILTRRHRTPFTVLFTNVINDHENGHVDLQLLNDFVECLKPARQVSEAIDRFHSLCSMFHQIAEAYISAKSEEAVMTEFDDYLTTLGLLPQNTEVGDAAAMSAPNAVMPTNYQDWYAGNIGLYGLIGDEINISNHDWNFELR